MKPWIYPLRADFDRGQLDLVELTPGSFELLTFHDVNHLATFPVAERWSFQQLFEVAEALRQQPRPPRYVFHGAFCGSTLLARYLELPGVTFAYREPAVLTTLNYELSTRDRGDLGRAVLAAAITLLTRTADDAEVAVIKGSDVVSAMAAPALAAYPGSRGVHISADLTSFVIACLGSDDRRAWVRRRHALLGSWPMGRALADVACSGDAEAAASVWLMHQRAAGALDLPRVTLDALVERPLETACEVAEQLELPADRIAENVARMLRDPVHAKSTAPYAAADHRARMARAQVRWADELARAHAWVEARA